MGQGHNITIPQLTLQLHFHDFQAKEVREPSEEQEVVVTIEKPPEAEPTYTTWKSARIFPMIFKKVRGLADRRGVIDLEEEEWQRRLEEEDRDYLRLELEAEEGSESTVESEEEPSSDYTLYTESEFEFSLSETTVESESETPSEEEESSTAESGSESTESEGTKRRKNIFLARRRPIAEGEVQAGPPREPELVLEEEERPEGEESELAPVEESTELESHIAEEGSARSASAEGSGESEEESESSSSTSESQSGGPWGFQVPEQDTRKDENQKKPPGANSEGYNTAL